MISHEIICIYIYMYIYYDVFACVGHITHTHIYIYVYTHIILFNNVLSFLISQVWDFGAHVWHFQRAAASALALAHGLIFALLLGPERQFLKACVGGS